MLFFSKKRHLEALKKARQRINFLEGLHKRIVEENKRYRDDIYGQLKRDFLEKEIKLEERYGKKIGNDSAFIHELEKEIKRLNEIISCISGSVIERMEQITKTQNGDGK